MITQDKNIAWFLPRPKRDRYKGGMPLHCEKNLISLAKELIHVPVPKILNLFCGMNTEGFRVDISKEVNPDLSCDIHELTKFHNNTYDVILADPPYSDKESRDLYNTGKLNYKKWTSEATKLLNEKGLLIVYHKYIMPNPNPDIFTVVKRVFIGSKIYHTLRAAIFFQKKPDSSHSQKNISQYEYYSIFEED